MQGKSVQNISNLLRDHIALNALRHIDQQVVKFLQYRRTDQTMAGYLLEIGISRRKAEARVRIGAAFPVAFVSALVMQNASLSRTEKSV